MPFDGALIPGVVPDQNAGTDILAASPTGQPPGGPDAAAPFPSVAGGALPAVTWAGAASYDFDVTWSDDTAVTASSLGDGDLVVSGPGGFQQAATFLGADPAGDGTPRVARYRVAAPGGTFDAADNGTYLVTVAPDQVRDTSGNAAVAGPFAGATFTVSIEAPPAPADGPDLRAVSLVGAVPASVVGGAKAKLKPLKLLVTNAGNAAAEGAVTIRLVASSDDVADAADAVVAELANQKVKLAPGKSKAYSLKAPAFPNLPDGDYRLLAVVDAGGAVAERDEANNAAALGTAVRIAPAFVDLALSSPALAGKLAPGRKAGLIVSAVNNGNQPAKGPATARVRLTPNPADPSAGRALDVPLKVSLKPGGGRGALKGKLALPADLPAGSYFVVVVESLTSAGWSDADPADDAATSGAAFVVQ